VARTMRVIHREHAGRPIRVAWTLEEIGEPYELTTMTREESRAQEHLARHPLGRVPVLESDEGCVFESAAICLYLADMYPEAGLVPALGTHERALVYQWTVFSPAEIEPPLIEAAIYGEKDPERASLARGRVDAAARAVADALNGNQFLVGDRFTVADVLVGSALSWPARAGFADILPDGLRDYVERLSQRPAYQRADARTSG
jgi:glutathione S-transferase